MISIILIAAIILMLYGIVNLGKPEVGCLPIISGLVIGGVALLFIGVN